MSYRNNSWYPYREATPFGENAEGFRERRHMSSRCCNRPCSSRSCCSSTSSSSDSSCNSHSSDSSWSSRRSDENCVFASERNDSTVNSRSPRIVVVFAPIIKDNNVAVAVGGDATNELCCKERPHRGDAL